MTWASNGAPSNIGHHQTRSQPGAPKAISNTSRPQEGNCTTHPMPVRPGNPERSTISMEHPLAPVKKPGSNDYRPVQDLCRVNEATETIHPVVPSLYTLLSLIPPTAKVFTCLDLKDAFFCLQLAEASQSLFAFEWEDPDTGAKGQLTWTRLPQGFKNSPTLFGEALAPGPRELPTKRLHHPPYVDDILWRSPLWRHAEPEERSYSNSYRKQDTRSH
jgi:hypothetical protein